MDYGTSVSDVHDEVDGAQAPGPCAPLEVGHPCQDVPDVPLVVGLFPQGVPGCVHDGFAVIVDRETLDHVPGCGIDNDD